jgi:signal peptidase II
MGERSFRGLFMAVALAGLFLDQASKYLVFGWLVEEQRYEVIPGAFNLEAHHALQKDGTLRPMVNHGALFGFLREKEELANGLFAVISVAAAGVIIYWTTRKNTARDWSLCAALGLILAGTLGNLYDRIVFSGVRDFLHVFYRQFDWPVFNVADACLVVGAGLLLVQAMFSRRPAETPDLHVSAPAPTADVK